MSEEEMFQYARDCTKALNAGSIEELERLSEYGRHLAGGFTVNGALVDPVSGEIQE